MGKRAKVTIIIVSGVVALGVVAAVLAPTVYRTFFVAPAAEAPTLSADSSELGNSEGADDLAADSQSSEEAPSGDPLDAATLNGEWAVAAGSYAGYRVDEVLNGSPVTVTGRTDAVAGTMTVEALTLQSAEFTVEVGSISTDSNQRDQYFRSQAIDTSTHPTATFVLTAPVAFENAPRSGEVLTKTLTGNLTIAGTTQPVEFEAQLRSDGEATEIAGQIPVVFADYGVQAPSLGFVSVESEGFVEFGIVATKR